MDRETRLRARKKALALLTDMDRTEAQLTEKLARAGFDEEAVRDAVEYVRGYGYINDARYADHYIEIMKESRSRRRIVQDLTMKKGLSGHEVEEALSRTGGGGERPLILRLAKKKLRTLHGDAEERRRKTAAYLMRQGFTAPDVMRVLEMLSFGEEE